MQLTAKNSEGKPANQPLPTLMTQVFFEEKTGQLAVIFDVKNSPDGNFYPNFTPKNPADMPDLQQDFLWQSHCYELFLAFENTENNPYVEINFSPTGEFNLYHFDSYRTPNQMPPRRLQVTENQRQSLLNFYRVSNENLPIFWQNSLSNVFEIFNQIEKNVPLTADSHRLVMVIDIKFLAEILETKKADKIWLNPCAVFRGEGAGEKEAVYFAHQHAIPPDFHNKNYWIKGN